MQAEAPPTPQSLLGPFYFGVILGTFLYGILVIQAITYYQWSKKSTLFPRHGNGSSDTTGIFRDELWLRLFILYLFIVETCSTAISVAMIYEPLVGEYGESSASYLVKEFLIVAFTIVGTGKPTSLFPSLLPFQPFLEAAVFVPVQWFYSWRCSVIMPNWIVPILICMTSITSAVGAIWTGVIVHRVKEYIHKPDVNTAALIWSVSAAGADVMITASLIWSLRNRRTTIKRTDEAIDTIIRNTVQTGALTVAFTLLDVILFVALDHSTLNFVFDFGLPKLYSNALLSTLNSRSPGPTGKVQPPNILFSESDPRGVVTRISQVPSAPQFVVAVDSVFERNGDVLALEELQK